MIFWIIFATVSFTTLVVSWGITIFILRQVAKTQRAIRKRGICPECGSPLLNVKNTTYPKKQYIGFRAND